MCPYTITVEEFKLLFDRGQFVYNDTTPPAKNAVRDKDIEEAIEEAELTYNCNLYPTDDEYKAGKKALAYLSAHFLVQDMQGSNSNGQPSFMPASKSADGISESTNIPPWMLEGDLAMYTTTSYGIKYLMLSKPYMDGFICNIGGGTTY